MLGARSASRLLQKEYVQMPWPMGGLPAEMSTVRVPRKTHDHVVDDDDDDDDDDNLHVLYY